MFYERASEEEEEEQMLTQHSRIALLAILANCRNRSSRKSNEAFFNLKEIPYLSCIGGNCGVV
jgi:hypothetical protein